MTVKYLETATCYFTNSDTKKQFPTFELAVEAAEAYCGNRSFAKPFADEETRLYGPGDGSASVIVRQDVDMEVLMGRTKE